MTKFSASQQSQLAQIGAFLREHREKQSKSLEDIAIRTYIRPQLLSGIETGNPDLLPEPIFVQGFIRRYAETLGLKGTELSQQFTVTSIPSTPRPPRPPESTESSTTRLTRRTPAPGIATNSAASAAASTSTNAAAGSTQSDPMFNAGSLSPIGEPFPNSPNHASEETAPSEPKFNPQDIPLVIDDEVLAQSTTPIKESTDLEPGISEQEPKVPAPEIESKPEIEIDFASPDFSNDAPAFSPQNLSTSSLDTNLEITPLNQETSAGGSDTSTTEFPQFDDTPLATFTTQSPQATPEAPPAIATRSPVYTPEPVGVEFGSDTDGPNLKPFAIGAVVIAAITGGMVLLANVLSSDRAPNVVDSSGSGDQSELVEPDTEILPELPPTPVVETPPASTAPVYVEAQATAETYVSVETDGVITFEGTMLPGDELLWEAQESIDVYSGNAGGLSIAANGGPSELLGESGQLGQKVFTTP